MLENLIKSGSITVLNKNQQSIVEGGQKYSGCNQADYGHCHTSK